MIKGFDRQIEQIQKCIARSNDASCAYYGGYYGYGGGYGEGPMSSNGAPADAKGAPPGTPTNGGGTTPAPSATSHSETNNQVQGVDEADFVKTDGANLYVIHGRSFKVLKAWPANDLKQLSSLDIEGEPSQMFVEGGKVVVYSTVNGAGLYKSAGVTPKEQYNDYVMYPGGGGRNVGAPSSAPYPYPGNGGTPEPYIPLTKITVLTLDANANASVAREMYFEGSYLDSRRVGTHVRTVLSGNAHGPKLKYGIYELYPQNNPSTGADSPPTRGGPTPGGGTTPSPTPDPNANPYPKTGTEMIAALEQLRSVNTASINASQLSDWLPYTFTKNGAAVQASSVACEDFYVPTTGSTESGLTEIASIDLANPGAMPRETAILGHAETVYGSTDTLYLAAQAWVEPPYSWQDNATSGSGSTSTGTVNATPPPPTKTAAPPAPTPGGARPQNEPTIPAPLVTAWAQNQTHIHKFEFSSDANFPNYVASGTVTGSVKDQFSMDDRAGYLRVATTENRTYIDELGKYVSPTPARTPGSDPSLPQDRPNTVNHVFVLGVSGPWLDTVGDVGEIGQNERIYSVRFIEGRGYIVTFRQVDPLFVLDLTNPKAPSKIAELTIAGFSEYMHPLDATHLLTIGRDATDAGQVKGLKLQIFDVANGANPIVAHTFTYSNNQYGQSAAEHDHKAFTYFADQHMLAFPYYAYNQTTPGGLHSSLELFKVDTATGFGKLGSIDHTPLVQNAPAGYCGGYYSPEVRRGVFLDNFVYAISYGGIIAKDATNLNGPGAQLVLPSPEVNQGYGYCGGPVPTGGK